MGKYEQLIYNHLHLSHTLDELQQIFKCGLACYEGQLADAEIAQLQRDKAELSPCHECGGRGTCNDAELGDISFNEWVCPACNGEKFFDYRKAYTALVERVKVHNVKVHANAIRGAYKTADACEFERCLKIDLDTQEGGVYLISLD